MSTLQQDALFIWWRIQGKKKLTQVHIIEDALINLQSSILDTVESKEK